MRRWEWENLEKRSSDVKRFLSGDFLQDSLLGSEEVTP
jgi:hypothetical protein